MKPKYSNEGGSFLILRDEHLLITGGNVVAAALIHIFEHWHYHKVAGARQNREANDTAERHGDRRKLPENYYQWHTTESLELQLKGLGSKRTIQEARQLLEELGIISEHRNPNPRYTFDRTIHFRFYPNVVAELLHLKDQVSNPSAQMSQREDDLSQCPYISSINNGINDNTDISADGAAVDKAPPGKKKRERKAPGAGDVYWQRWVDRYDKHVKDHNDGLPHRWDGAQLGPQGLKGIREHLVKISTKLEGKSDDDCGYGAWCFILDHWKNLGDDWIRGQFDLTVLLKKITEILNRLRNATNTNRSSNSNGAKTGTSQARVDALANY